MMAAPILLVGIGILNNLWVIAAALLVFMMTAAVGLLEIGELGEGFGRSLFKSVLITGIALVIMAAIGFNVAFAPAISGVIGNPAYVQGFFLGAFASIQNSVLGNIWWSTTANYFNTGLLTSAYYLFEAAFASVTFALVSVVALKKVKMSALLLLSLVYFTLIWTLPAAWVWNPTGWLYGLGVRDFAGGLVVHAAAGAAGLALVLQIWREEKQRGLRKSPSVKIKVSPGWLTLSLLLLWIGWFGFNAGSVLAFTSGALAVVLATFLAASSSLLTMLLIRFLITRRQPSLDWVANGVLMGLIVITPLAGFVSPASSIVIGMLGAIVYVAAERCLSGAKWFSDPIGLFPGHFVGGIFGVLMIAFFAQSSFAAASGNAGLPNGLLFGGGAAAFWQLCIEAFAIITVIAFVFLLSFASVFAIGRLLNGITDDGFYKPRSKT
jgi:Amt family ammonium transporter